MSKVKIKLSRQIILDGQLRKPSEGEIEVSEAAAERAANADALAKPEAAAPAKPESKPQSPSQPGA